VGTVGATVGANLHDRVFVGAGAGASNAGFQLGAFVRGRPLVGYRKRSLRLHAPAIEVGYSVGAWEPITFLVFEEGVEQSGPHERWDLVHWVQVDIAWETRAQNGTSVRLGAGPAIPVARRGYRCVREPCDAGIWPYMAGITAEVGYAF
jgi:hypothetical protein